MSEDTSTGDCRSIDQDLLRLVNFFLMDALIKIDFVISLISYQCDIAVVICLVLDCSCSMSYPFLDYADSSTLAIAVCLYTLLIIIIVLPPTELTLAGFSIPNLFAYIFVENEDTSFIRYHIKRFSLKYLTHSFLPLGYIFVILYYCDWSFGLWAALISLLTETSLIVRLILTLCIVSPSLTSLIVLRWHMNDCYQHPIVRQLRLFIPTNNGQQEATWHNVESSINTEFRRYDKFSIGLPTSNVRCYVLDSWIIKCSMYHMNIAQQSNARVELIEAEDIHLQETNEQATLSTQYLNIMIRTADSRVQPFCIR